MTHCNDSNDSSVLDAAGWICLQTQTSAGEINSYLCSCSQDTINQSTINQTVFVQCYITLEGVLKHWVPFDPPGSVRWDSDQDDTNDFIITNQKQADQMKVFNKSPQRWWMKTKMKNAPGEEQPPVFLLTATYANKTAHLNAHFSLFYFAALDQRKKGAESLLRM